MKCPYCGKQVPMTLPPYRRIYKGKDGHWHPYSDICQCNKEMYDFMVLGLIKKKEKKSIRK
ncbi:hypothetical protein DRZ78_01770 [Candidatus Aerophobetes bacterium]|uniref:Uncharacterized protein n=1 Tax=Aerophobetes bacterium TaxID=2030807 RepID=A0A662D233_UNCAE|nr:MAG: hypothetical protein DRZ78_01770 [Candidatus Aerophobetes bacterium]